jgi:DNA mismatch repair ATPase MutS
MTFTYTRLPGQALSPAYGIRAALQSGLDESLVNEARELLGHLQATETEKDSANKASAVPTQAFAAATTILQRLESLRHVPAGKRKEFVERIQQDAKKVLDAMRQLGDARASGVI